MQTLSLTFLLLIVIKTILIINHDLSKKEKLFILLKDTEKTYNNLFFDSKLSTEVECAICLNLLQNDEKVI